MSGKACRMGSSCNKNLVTGFYSCEIDGDEVGAWDYCCKADYPCGYSQGFDYPWYEICVFFLDSIYSRQSQKNVSRKIQLKIGKIISKC